MFTVNIFKIKNPDNEEEDATLELFPEKDTLKWWKILRLFKKIPVFESTLISGKPYSYKIQNIS